MVLTNGQEKGLKIAVERYKNGEPYTVIAGYAGTGKSTLVSHIVDALNISPLSVCYVAFTGKASLVLREKGCENSMTAHKLLYHSKEKPDGTFEHKPRKCLEYNYKLIVVDEVSMIPADMWTLLLSHNIHIIALGDPFQLPAINGESDILSNPHVFLNEVVRQAQDNPIIKLSMDVRNGKPLVYGGDKRCRVMTRSSVSDKLLLGANQILCGKNATRHSLNEYIRKLKWGEQYLERPLDGKKVICLKNKWDIVGSDDNPLINGQLGVLKNVKIKNINPYGDILIADFISDNGGIYKNLMIDYKLITEGNATINSDNWKQFAGYPKLLEFAFGYVVTVHKFEGSEAPRILCFYEAFGDEEQKRRWTYTAITRASEQLVIVK